MQLTEVPPRDFRPLITEVHTGLLALLAPLRDADWAAPTEAGRRTVKDVAPAPVRPGSHRSGGRHP
jgi:hypothetical protein